MSNVNSSNSDNTSNNDKLRQKCPYGFDCGSMMLLPGTIAHDCENLTECKSLTAAMGVSWSALNQPTFELVQYIEENTRYWQEQEQQWQEERQRVRYIRRVQQHEAAVMLLKQRGNPQSFQSFNLSEQIPVIEQALNTLKDNLDTLNRGYIAPDQVEAHVYSVKHPSTGSFPDDMTLEEIRASQSIYYYHKLLSKTPQFEAVQTPTVIQRLQRGGTPRTDPTKCKVIHLSHGYDARNIQGRIGIERRNRLSKIQTRLLAAAKALEEAAELATLEFSYDDVLARSEEAESQE